LVQLAAASWDTPLSWPAGLDSFGKRFVWQVDHFFSGHKPWRRKTRCGTYFDFLKRADFTPPPAAALEALPCMAMLREKADCLLPNLNQTLNRTACLRCMRLGQKSTCRMPPRCPPETRWPAM